MFWDLPACQVLNLTTFYLVGAWLRNSPRAKSCQVLISIPIPSRGMYTIHPRAKYVPTLYPAVGASSFLRAHQIAKLAFLYLAAARFQTAAKYKTPKIKVWLLINSWRSEKTFLDIVDSGLWKYGFRRPKNSMRNDLDAAKDRIDFWKHKKNQWS